MMVNPRTPGTSWTTRDNLFAAGIGAASVALFIHYLGINSPASFWDEAGTAVTHALGYGKQDEPPSDPRSNLP